MSFAIPPETLAANPRVFMYSAGGRPVVVKKREKPDRIFVHVFQNALAKICGDPLLLCADPPRRGKCLEAEKLKTLAESGMSVPKVLYEAEGYFVMEYVGSSLCDILASALDSGKKEALVAGALSKLRALHEKGFAHGGAHIKNFTCFGKEIYMVDFEEVIPPGHLESFKTRDLLVFLLSMEACSLSPDLARICEAYGGKSGRAVREKLERELLRYRFLKFLNMKIFKHIKMNDVRAAISLIEKAEKTVA